MNSNKRILLTIDVEDWFQVENFKPWIPFSTWDQRELRVERNVHQLLDLFDSIKATTNTARITWDIFLQLHQYSTFLILQKCTSLLCNQDALQIPFLD